MLETTTQGITDSILLLSKDLEILWANKTALEETGCEMAEVLGKRCHEVTHRRETPCDGGLDPCPIQELQASGEPVSVTHFHPGQDGKQAFLEVTVYPIRDEKGDVVQFVHVSRDVTERKRAEDALRGSEARYRLLAENVTDVIWTTDTNLRFTYVSPSVTRMRGDTVEEMMGRKLKEILTPASLEAAMEVFAEERAIEESDDKDLTRSRTVELEQTCKDGSTAWAEAKLTILRNSDRQPIGILGITRDITDRKRAEEALRESEEKYRRLVQDSIDGIAILEGPNIRFANPALLEMFGCQSEEELVGHAFTEFLSAEYREALLERNRAREQGQQVPTNYELKALREDGSELDVEVSIGRIAYRGKVATQAVVRDISERKRAEKALRKAREDIESRVERRMQEVNGYSLTFRELTVLHLVVAGQSDKEIAIVLGISPLTAHKHLANILDKMGAASRTEAGVRALREGLLD